MYVTQNSHREGCDVVYVPGEPLNYTVGQSIFVKTNYIRKFFSTVSLNVPFIIVTGLSDFSPSTFFNDDQLKELLENPMLIEWRAQNVCFEHPKLIHLPIGLEDTPEKLEFYAKHSDKLRAMPKKNETYINFSIETNPTERVFFSSNLGDKVSFEEYMYIMSTYKYVMCPMGNGIDTHRFWEAQLCGCIPIVRCPKEFLPTYKGVPFISIPGKCHARLGYCMLVRQYDSIFVENSLANWSPV